MDVSCPRCKTDYEFDDARVPDAGVTVKCTQCSHVFRVRKKSVPSSSAPPHQRPGDETEPGLPKHASATREWKVRQPTGNVFSFKELTTLQKWIVERKVSRDDEISLTGEAWKRLGNIAELASFFQVVDDAKKVQELEALQQMKDKLSTTPGGSPAMPGESSVTQSGAGLMPLPVEQQAVAYAQRNRGEPATLPPEESPKKKLTETMREPSFITPPPRSKPEQPPPFRAPPPPSSELLEIQSREDLRQMKSTGGSGLGTWLALFLVLAGLGGAGGWYFVVYMPEQQRAKEVAELQARARADEEAKLKDEEARKALEKAEADRKAKEDEDRKKAEALAAAAVPDAGPAVPDAGALAAVNSGSGSNDPRDTTAKEPTKDGKKAGCKNADCFIAQGDRLRDRDRPEAALDAYGHALDLSAENVEALTGKGLCLLDMAKPLQAEPVLEQALKINARYAPALMGLAESYRFQGKKELAIGMYQKYLDNFPNAPEAGVAKSNIDRLR